MGSVMLKKRLIGVITVRDGLAVQSIGYKRYLPLGKPEYLAENLDRWGADEILVMSIDRTVRGLGPDLGLLKRLGKVGIRTPLIVAGGISSKDNAIEVVHSGADRICIDALLQDNPEEVRAIAECLGSQAVIASLPVSAGTASYMWWDYRSKALRHLATEVCALLEDGVVSEVLLVDWQHEGIHAGFDQRLIERFPIPNVPLIAFGGVSHHEQIEQLLNKESVSAVAIGNFLSYREHAIQHFKMQLQESHLRGAVFAGSDARV